MRPKFPAIICFAVLVPLSGRAQQPMRLTLADAEKLAIQNNPQFSAAKFSAAAAYQVPAQYQSNFSPTVYSNFTGVGADAGSRLAAGSLNNPVVYNRLGSGLSINQLITDFGRTSNLVASAKLHAQAQDQVTESTRADILMAVHRAYFGVLRAEAVLKVARQTVDARQVLVDQVTALAQSKLKSALDVSFANVNLADAKLLLTGAQNDLKAMEAQLGAAMGLPNEPGFVLTEERLPAPLPDTIDPLVRQAIRDRPELASLRLQESSEQRFAQAEHALFFPTIGVLGTAGFVPAGEVAVPGRYGAIGLNVTIPIFNGGLFKARHAEAELRAKAAGQNVSDLENRVARDVRMAYLNAATAEDRMALTAQLLQQARLALDLAKARYDLGLSSIVELSQAQLNVTSAEIAGATAKYDYQTQWSLLEYQIGALR
jgi:outer membrane protein